MGPFQTERRALPSPNCALIEMIALACELQLVGAIIVDADEDETEEERCDIQSQDECECNHLYKRHSIVTKRKLNISVIGPSQPNGGEEGRHSIGQPAEMAARFFQPVDGNFLDSDALASQQEQQLQVEAETLLV